MIQTTSHDRQPGAGPELLHLLVIIEPRQALIFRSEMVGSLPERVVAHVTNRNPIHVHDPQDHGGRQSRPAGPSYYTAIADGLEGAGEILMFSTGEGGRKAMDALIEELRSNYAELFACVVGSQSVDGKHISDELLLEKAREFYQATNALGQLQDCAAVVGA